MLLLIAVNDKGHVAVGTSAFVKVGLTGALLAELAMAGQLIIAADGTVRAEQTRPGDELLADVYDAVREDLQGRKAKQVIRGLSRYIGGSRERVVDRLVGVGVLGRDRPSILRLACLPFHLLDVGRRLAFGRTMCISPPTDYALARRPTRGQMPVAPIRVPMP